MKQSVTCEQDEIRGVNCARRDLASVSVTANGCGPDAAV